MSTILGLQTVPRILRYSFRVTTETPKTRGETLLAGVECPVCHDTYHTIWPHFAGGVKGCGATVLKSAWADSADLGRPDPPAEVTGIDRVVAFCDRWEPVLERAEKFLHNPVAAYLKSPARPRVPGKKQP
jgi:hypothetical protein